MGAGHDHGAGASTRKLGLALALTFAFFTVELVGGFVFNSLALLSDAAHMFTDSAALGIALVAAHLAKRPPDDRRTFGYRRVEILAAAFNALLLLGAGLYILYEGVLRLLEPQAVDTSGMLWIAVGGLLVNLIAMLILRSDRDKSLNVKGAYLEVWADMLGSLGVIVGALLIRFTGETWIDPVIAIAIGLWVMPRAFILLRDTSQILLQGTPADIPLPEVRAKMAAIDGVAGVHDLHLWGLTANDLYLSSHVQLAPGADFAAVHGAIAHMLHETWHIDHVTLQPETGDCLEGHAPHA